MYLEKLIQRCVEDSKSCNTFIARNEVMTGNHTIAVNIDLKPINRKRRWKFDFMDEVDKGQY